MWVANDKMGAGNVSDKIYAYNLATKARLSSRDFTTIRGVGNIDPTGLWSDGIPPCGSRISGTTRSTPTRCRPRPAILLKNSTPSLPQAIMYPTGIWSDGITMWVADPDDSKIYAYSMSNKARNTNEDFNQPSDQDSRSHE